MVPPEVTDIVVGLTGDMLAFSNSMLPNVALLVAVIEAVLRVVPFTCSVLVREPSVSVLMPTVPVITSR